MTKFTEGPWKAEAYNLRMGSLISAGDISKGQTVANSFGQKDPNVGKANAALIAAAPDMYEVLVEMSALFDGDGFRKDLAGDLDGLLARTDAVLAKAEGRTAIKEGK